MPTLASALVGVGFLTLNSSFQPSPIFDGVALAIGKFRLDVYFQNLAMKSICTTYLNLSLLFPCISFFFIEAMITMHHETKVAC